MNNDKSKKSESVKNDHKKVPVTGRDVHKKDDSDKKNETSKNNTDNNKKCGC
jgi:hypothetical protein